MACVLVLLSWQVPTAASASPVAGSTPRSGPLAPLPPTLRNPEPARAALGERLFRDPGLSADGQIACASCHFLEHGGADPRPVSPGVHGASGTRNAPSVFNTALNTALFWDGRARTLAEQIEGPLHDPAEMGSSWAEVIDYLSASADYRAAFAALYPQGIDRHSISDALVRYQLTLVTPNAPFDRWLRGDPDAISAEARAGYARFKSLGCASCHQGANIGGNLFQRFGIMGNYFSDRGRLSEADLGRYNLTGRDEDLHVFRVPSLRNVALTGPWLHDGSATSLREAVEIMARYQLGREIDAEDIRLILAFLDTLTGETPDGTRILSPP